MRQNVTKVLGWSSYREAKAESLPLFILEIDQQIAQAAADKDAALDAGEYEPRDSVGIATFRLELPTNTINKLRHNTASVHQRRS